MALSKSYYTVDGEILGERTVSGRVNYGVDALGSVTSTLVGDAVQNRYAYKPYGDQLSRSGAGSDPSFRWVGSLGYRQTGRAYSESYVRLRHYARTLGRWTTIDPLTGGSRESARVVAAFLLRAYAYAGQSPLSFVDPSGLLEVKVCHSFKLKDLGKVRWSIFEITGSLSVQYCLICYNCPKKSDCYASLCHSIAIRGCVDIVPKFLITPSDIIDMMGDATKLFDRIHSVVVGLIAGFGTCSSPSQINNTCKPSGITWDVQLNAGICACNFSAGIEWHYGSHSYMRQAYLCGSEKVDTDYPKTYFQFSNCGMWPRATACVSGRIRSCYPNAGGQL